MNIAAEAGRDRRIAIIVPLGPGEDGYEPLVQEINQLQQVDVVFVCVEGERSIHHSRLSKTMSQSFRLLESPRGRAHQLNHGVKATTCSFLWFVHADTTGVVAVEKKLRRRMNGLPNSVWFSNLRFSEPRPEGIQNNEIGVWWRSHYLRMPFGDQGLACSRKVFDLLGGFDPAAPYGEDHLFVWMAHRLDVPLRFSGGVLWTSPRKYLADRKAMTRKHRGLAFAQAWPQFMLWLRRL